MIYLVIILIAALGVALFFVNKLARKNNILKADLRALQSPKAWHRGDQQDYVKGPCTVVEKNGTPFGVVSYWMTVAYACKDPLEIASLVNIGYLEGQQNPRK